MVTNNGVNDERVSFFQVIIPGLSTEKLKIPPQFLEFIREDLSSYSVATLSLKRSSQRSWIVKVTEAKNKVYFKEGWQEFLKDNSVNEGEFVTFTYEGEMHFELECFDMSCCERVDFPNGTSKESTAANSTKRTCANPSNDNIDEADISFTSKFPCYIKAIKSTNCVYSIPTAFYRKHLSAGNHKFALVKISGGNKWYKVKLAPSCRKGGLSLPVTTKSWLDTFVLSSFWKRTEWRFTFCRDSQVQDLKLLTIPDERFIMDFLQDMPS